MRKFVEACSVLCWVFFLLLFICSVIIHSYSEKEFTIEHHLYSDEYYPKYGSFYISRDYDEFYHTLHKQGIGSSEYGAIYTINKYAEKVLGKNVTTRKVKCVELSTVNGKIMTYILDEESVQKPENMENGEIPL